MTPQEREELRQFIREAVVAGLRDHPCRFGESQAAVLHEAAKRLTPDDVIAVAWLAARMRGTADSAGRWVARVVLLGIVGLLGVGVAVLAWGVHRGWISPPGP